MCIRDRDKISSNAEAERKDLSAAYHTSMVTSGITITISVISLIAAAILAVSYTHLDVYKRQHYHHRSI